MYLSPQERDFCEVLRNFPRQHGCRYTTEARNALIQSLFLCLCGNSPEYLSVLFNNAPQPQDARWSLRQAQGAVEGAEYTEAARGHPCGHIFKSGETTYRCRTCSADDTCVLCARCFEGSDHEGHNVFVSLSPGNSGCCDCGDPEAWLRNVDCSIHSLSTTEDARAAGKAPDRSQLPQDLVESIKMTIARAMDYLCDVFSCSPEQLRLTKTATTVKEDERMSRLPARVYSASEQEEEDLEYALVLWNDEKHTVNDVRDQVSRACKIAPDEAFKKAIEIDDVGRTIIAVSQDLSWLLGAAKIIEQPKLTVTIRSARDTFREQMCATIIEWIGDIAGCSVGPDHNILRETICEQLLRPWRVGSQAHHQGIGTDGLDDHEIEDMPDDFFRYGGRYPAHVAARLRQAWGDDDATDDDNDTNDEDTVAEDTMDVDRDWAGEDMDIDAMDDPTMETSEATMAGYPPPPPPPPQPRRRFIGQAGDSSEGEGAGMPMSVPKTPQSNPRPVRMPKPPRYWLERPEAYRKDKEVPIAEDLWRRVRLDYLILYDLRMWKQLRTDLRDVLISTVVTLPHFKRLLGIRFAGVYTVLIELYLIADREPDHSVINLSLQMLTTPSITAEIVERGNFLSNMMAIMYTFLTTRQVGYPTDVNLATSLAFDQGAVTNRRTYHFYVDLKYLLASELVQECLRSEERYLLQFLDLAKLQQGICPNVRAVGEHVEFETDTWLSASIFVQEIIRLCKLFGECFVVKSEQDFPQLCRAIRNSARAAIISSLGAERKRFDQSEIKGETRFKILPAFEFERDLDDYMPHHRVVDFIVSQEPISFHHALHYTLSWLIDKGKAMSKEQLLGLLLFSTQELKQAPHPGRLLIPETQSEENLLALFDFPLRVVAWLAQMRAGMWVRNGITLRHQMSAYRGHPRRELSYQRDIFLLQTAMVILPPAQVLASMIDRFDLTDWIQGNHSLRTGQDEQQKIDIAEDFVHLLIIILSDRIHLLPTASEPEPQLMLARRDIIHNLCFKPLTFSILCNHITDKFSDTDAFDTLIQEMTVFRPPEGVVDNGTFALKDQFFEDVDPYLAHFTRNQRDEAENIYKKHMAKKLGIDAADVVFEPKLRKIDTGLFTGLADFTRLPLFAQVIFYLLQYAIVADRFAPTVPGTKVEQFLQFILHLTLLAVMEDGGQDEPMVEGVESFCRLALTKRAKHPLGSCDTIALLLRKIGEMETFKSAEPKVKMILKVVRKKRPREYTAWMHSMDLPVERSESSTPIPDKNLDRETKKKQAFERQAKVMAQFKAQQNNFMQNQASIDWGDDDFSDLDEEFATPKEDAGENVWNYPSGTCILCQEETNDEKLYGTFALINDSRILRQTDTKDEAWVGEAIKTPESLDRNADDVRPFGVAGDNKIKVTKISADGRTTELERVMLARGFPMRQHTSKGVVATGCGHIMHFSCFEVYVQATHRRQMAAIARQHPEKLDQREFLCPLCKALGNAFLPVIWKAKPVGYSRHILPEKDFNVFLEHTIGVKISKMEKIPEIGGAGILQKSETLFLEYGKQQLISNLANNLKDLTKVVEAPTPSSAFGIPPRGIQFSSMSLIFPLPADEPIPASALMAGMPFSSLGDSAPSASTTNHMLPQLAELVKVYRRLTETMTTNELSSSFSYPQGTTHELTRSDTLAWSLGYSIAAAEIAQRGVQSAPGTTLLDTMSSQTLTHLRVLSETILSYIAIGSLRNGGNNLTNQEFSDSYLGGLRCLFVGHPEVCGVRDLSDPTSKKNSLMLDRAPLLTQDPFIFLSECAAFLQPALHLDIQHLIRLCYQAEIVRVIISFLLKTANPPSSGTCVLPEQGRDFLKLASSVYEQLADVPGDVRRLLVDPEDYSARIYQLAKAYALPFLRKCVVLMHVRYGVDFPVMVWESEGELERLSQALLLPDFNTIVAESLAPASLNLISGWIKHWILYRAGSRSTLSTITLSHPAIFELVGLPRNFDTLQDEAMRRKCPKSGKDMTDPVVCLFCAEIFCSQAVCCKNENNKGGCWQHRQECGGPVGLFMNIRKCMVLGLNGESGTWSFAPYLDKHGETDATLRRHHQLYLHQKRYDKLYRDVWLAHQLPSAIARRLEGETNNGGWDTL